MSEQTGVLRVRPQDKWSWQMFLFAETRITTDVLLASSAKPWFLLQTAVHRRGPEPWAVITYADEPSPETGHVGWCWWARGSMGDAPSYEAARDAAVAEIQRRMDRRMAVL